MPCLEEARDTKARPALQRAAYTNNNNSEAKARSEVVKRKPPRRKERIICKYRKYSTILYKVTLYLFDSLC